MFQPARGRDLLILVSAAQSMLVGIVVLFGWAVDNGAIKSILPGFATMKANTAVALFLCGMALFTRYQGSGFKLPAIVGLAGAISAAAVGAATLVEYGFHLDLGIDQLLFRDAGTVHAAGAPGRMAGATALVFVMLGAALVASCLKRDVVAQTLAAVAAFIAFLACTGYAYSVSSLYSLAPYSSMAVHTAVTLLLVCLGVFAASANSGPASLFGGEGSAGMISRRLVPAVTILPLILGFLLVAGLQARFYRPEFGLALFVVAIIVVLDSTVLWTTTQLRRSSADRDATEAKLRESEERFRLVVESAPNGVVMVDRTGRIVLVNAQAEKMFGYSRQELLGEPIEVLVPERFRDRHPESRNGYLAAPVARGMGIGRDLFGRHKDGSEFPVEIGLNPIQTEHGLLVVSAIVDISGRKRAEAERQKFVSLADSSGEFIGMCDRNFRPFYANEAALRIVGLEDMDAACRTRVQDYFFPEDQAFITNDFFPRVLHDGHGEVEIRFRHFQTGEAIWMIYNVFNIRDVHGDIVGWATVSRNIHDRKQAEQALRDSEERMRAFFENSAVIAWVKDAEGRHVYLSQNCETRFGARRKDWQGTTDFDFWPTAIADKFRENDLLVLRENRSIEVIEEAVSTDGNRSWWMVHKFPYQDTSGKRFVGGLGVDITERKLVEQALRESEERFRLAQQVAQVGTFEWNIQTGVNRWTPQLEAMYGLPSGGFSGSQDAWERLIHPNDRAEAVRQVQKAMKTGGFEAEWRVIWPDGSVHWIAGRARVFKDDNGNPLRLLGVNIDITDRKVAEQTLREKERRFVEQTIAAREDEQRRIARDLHDGIGQSLTSVRLGLRVVEDAASLDAASATAKKLRSMVVAAQDEVRRLARNLRPSVLDDLGLGPALARIAEDFSQTHGIRISLQVPDLQTPRLPEATETALFRIAQEALTNVVKHADATEVDVVIDRDAEGVEMTISDNGVGLEVAATKPSQSGCGLMGMRERASLLNGSVRLHGHPRGGVSITVAIPHSEGVSV